MAFRRALYLTLAFVALARSTSLMDEAEEVRIVNITEPIIHFTTTVAGTNQDVTIDNNDYNQLSNVDPADSHLNSDEGIQALGKQYAGVGAGVSTGVSTEFTTDELQSCTGENDYCKDSNQYARKENQRVEIDEDLYERLVYFSKACCMTNCISDGLLFQNKTLREGGCPQHLKFCSAEEDNPTVNNTHVEMVLSADRGEMGTGYVIVDHPKNVIIIAFRGSSTRQDWFNDFQIFPTNYAPGSLAEYNNLVESGKIDACEDCKIHRGFYRFRETLGRQFLHKVDSIFETYPTYNIVVVGHSLGAAMASIAAIELKLRGYEPTVFTYAMPRIFNGSLKAWIDKLFHTERIHEESIKAGKLMYRGGYFRIIHNQDYIPMVPPFYDSAGLEIFIKKIELPHLIEDLEYRGKSTSAFDYSGFEPNTFEYVQDWLHMYEHRAYFILIKDCSGF
ncbi:hypothetical protein Kpol_1028p87 [Vanderwaltozyma polyspora DSM 70294]|uniref:triacylglycerol lipase n=1 Tax=Vanderwaltozyma polyspora (strain ATCC 22028 / DSM 70294 / BCRC 21397 / CBS 2163 / NBRC 10782 / NRRL Y-8283 / UCD 57-17) TaxID=436907 RepID=A7TG54_VANPO|nr:uncharacterized protein Kpol_1028p87 [Vanderwaltozyma polyspora DSM 70294]EDO18811.1 hypothetical protein Kpol_1028p87 [Vanderwaltozyma polyspora DSM 70294]